MFGGLVRGEETLRQATTLTDQLRQTEPTILAVIARERGDAKRGAEVFYTSPAACVNCHLSNDDRPPSGQR